MVSAIKYFSIYNLRGLIELHQCSYSDLETSVLPIQDSQKKINKNKKQKQKTKLHISISVDMQN